jgi:hypothetical protein
MAALLVCQVLANLNVAERKSGELRQQAADAALSKKTATCNGKRSLNWDRKMGPVL